MKHPAAKLVLLALASLVLASMGAAGLTAQQLNPPPSPTRLHATLHPGAAVRLQPSLLLGNKTLLEGGEKLQAPRLLVEEVTLNPSLETTSPLRPARSKTLLHVYVDGYWVKAHEEETQGAPRPLRVDLQALHSLAARAAREAGLPEPRETIVKATIETTLETPGSQRLRLHAEALIEADKTTITITQKPGEATAEEPQQTTPRTPAWLPRGAAALAALAAGSTGLIAAAAATASRKKAPIPRDKTVPATIAPDAATALIHDPKALVDIAHRAGAPILLDEEKKLACTPLPGHMLCTNLETAGNPSREAGEKGGA